MLKPSYTELMEMLNDDENVDMTITSRYTIVIAAAKRARQLISGAQPLSTAISDKSVSMAINEMAEGKINITVTENNPEAARKTSNSEYRLDYLSQEDLGFE